MPPYDRIVLAVVSGYLRHTRIESGRWRLIPFAISRAKRVGPKLGRRIVGTRYGFRMDLDMQDRFGQHVYATGAYEDSTSDVISALLNPGDVFVDVGANAGYFSLLAARRVKGQGRVHAFEPIPANQDEIRRNARLNGFPNIEVHPIALSDHDGETALHLGPARHSGMTSLRPMVDSTGLLRVGTHRLDDALPPGSPVRLIKIDVEGAELHVLRGACSILERDHPDLIIEVTDVYLRQMGGSAHELWDSLTALGYCGYRIGWHGLRRDAGKDPDIPRQYNALFSMRPKLTTTDA